jgi:hypothetical protein
MNRDPRMTRHVPGPLPRQEGQALLVVLVILLVVTSSSASFIWFMNQQQSRAGTRHRELAALRLAEAGVYRTLAVLESAWPPGPDPGSPQPPEPWEERIAAGPLEGRLSVSVDLDTGGTLLVTSRGEVGGAVRRLVARVALASPALLAALYGATVVQFDQAPAALFILPYGAGLGDRPWFHIAAGQEVSFVQTRVVLNDSAHLPDPFPGPVDAPEPPRAGPRPAIDPVRILLAADARLTLEDSSVTVAQLRGAGIRLDESLRRVDRLPPPPEVDREYYRTLASANAANAALNRGAGRFTGDQDLEQKPDSLYSRDQMVKVLTYLETLTHEVPMRGVIYVSGRVTVPARSRVHIADGALIAESTVLVDEEAELRVTHGPSTRSLPGIITLRNGALIVAKDARLRAHGLVYSNRVFDTGPGALVEVVGALVSNDPSISVRTNAATVVIRYDPAVLGTPGLIATAEGRIIAWVAAWEELPR